jgi:hypothetical protein
MATRAVLQVGLALEESPASLAAELEDISNDRTSVLRLLERVISRVQHRGHKLAVRVDSSTDGSTQFPLGRASVSVAITQASNASGTVTIQYRGDSRLGGIIGITETGGGQVITGSDFALDTTVAKGSESYLFTDGGLR